MRVSGDARILKAETHFLLGLFDESSQFLVAFVVTCFQLPADEPQVKQAVEKNSFVFCILHPSIIWRKVVYEGYLRFLFFLESCGRWGTLIE